MKKVYGTLDWEIKGYYVIQKGLWDIGMRNLVIVGHIKELMGY